MVQADRIKLLAIVGCTAVGKSETALKLAKQFNGELIGADSMQIYKGFDVGTGKLTKDECGGVVHKMIDIVDGDSDFSVGEYVELAKKEIQKTIDRGKTPIVVGGTGLYVYSLLSGCNFADAPKNEGYRRVLKLTSHFFGQPTMHTLLCNVDGVSAQKISANDGKRVIRALEIFFLRGKPKSDVVVRDKPYDDLTIVLTLPRPLLYERINARVKKMFDNGLIEETKRLIKYKDHGSMQALGYKQIASEPTATREYLESVTAQKTRNYAKRQTTYFNNMKLNKVFIDARNYNEVTDVARRFWEKNNE